MLDHLVGVDGVELLVGERQAVVDVGAHDLDPARAGRVDVLRDEVDARHPRRADALGDALRELPLVRPDVQQCATASGRQHAQHGTPVLFLGGVEEPFEAALRRRSVAHSAATAFLKAA